MTPSNVALAVLGGLAVVMLVFVIQKDDPTPSLPISSPVAAPSVRPASVPPQSVAFVGDGYTSGSLTGGLGTANYTALLSGRDGWRVTNLATYGSGYVAGGAPLGTQVAQAADARPQLVVVTGGRADSDQNPAEVRDAAGRVFQDLRARLPQTPILVIGPMWLGEDPPSKMNDVRDAIRDAAAADNLPFVDPISDRWFNGDGLEGIAPNGDLNDLGHQRLAELVGTAVRQANALPR